MLRPLLLAGGLAAALGLCACAPTDESATEPGGPTEVLAATADNGSTPPAPSTPVVSTSVGPAPTATETPAPQLTFAGSVRGPGQYQLFEMPAGAAGEQVDVAPLDNLDGYLIAVLFDADMNLIARAYVTGRWGLTHVLRTPTSKLFLGVTSASDGRGASFKFGVSRKSGVIAPPPRAQSVYLNFDGASGLSVNQRPAISFDAFDATTVNASYAGHTPEIKAAIVRTIREDYAVYNVAIVSSDDGPPPDGEHATVYFGGTVAELLGLADGVDPYNADAGQNAVVYTSSFAPYRTMRLTPEQMGVMIGNVGSHELGHLLGLYHTADGHDVMDTTGTAWDLVGAQVFTRTGLEENVFPIGYEDSPRLLMQIVGPAKAASKSLMGPYGTATAHGWIRRMVQSEMPHTCGTCLHLDP